MTTQQTQTIAKFVLARVAEDEEAARKAESRSGARWDADVNAPIGVAVVTTDEAFSDAYRGEAGLLWDWEGGYVGCAPEAAAHIARNDPARVLAQCAAHRAIVELHPDYGGYGEACATCADSDIDLTSWPCPTLRALAAIWSDAPGYRSEWAL